MSLRIRGFLWVLLVGLVVESGGCARERADGRRRAVARRRPAQRPNLGQLRASCAAVQDRLLPAGIYFRDHAYDGCREKAPCPAPGVAVILGVFQSGREAERAAAHVAPGLLPPGYPLLVHTDELGLADAAPDGIVVVAGLLPHAEALRQWLTGCPLPGLRPALLTDRRTAAARFSGSPQRRHYAVRIRPGDAVAAYAEPDLETLDHGRSPARPAPLCHLAAGRVFPFSTRHLKWRRWAPVRCGDQKAYVRWTDTLLETVIKRRADGSVIRRQVVSVECDQPELRTWVRKGGGGWVREPAR